MSDAALTIGVACVALVLSPLIIALVLRQARRNAPPARQPWQPEPEQQGPWGSLAMRGLKEAEKS